MIGEIQEAAGHLNRLVGDLLDVTWLESGQVKPVMETSSRSLRSQSEPW
jgi:K+-sensing histidine kinase KdpD